MKNIVFIVILTGGIGIGLFAGRNLLAPKSKITPTTPTVGCDEPTIIPNMTDTDTVGDCESVDQGSLLTPQLNFDDEGFSYGQADNELFMYVEGKPYYKIINDKDGRWIITLNPDTGKEMERMLLK